jgi:hypothetical protein
MQIRYSVCAVSERIFLEIEKQHAALVKHTVVESNPQETYQSYRSEKAGIAWKPGCRFPANGEEIRRA